MQLLTKWILGALFAVIMLLAPAFAGLTYRTLAEDIKDNREHIEKLDEAVQEIKTQGAVQEALQNEQNKLLREVVTELKNGRRRDG